MTPAEHARQIDKEEFAAESKAAIKRALAYAKQRRFEDRQKVLAFINSDRQAPEPKFVVAGRSPKTYTINGVSRTLVEWASHLGVAVSTLETRRRRLGSIEAAIAMGCQRYGGGRQPIILEHDGQTRPLSHWAAIAGLKPNTIHRRLSSGWSIADALTLPLNAKPGVSPDFKAIEGTGAGSTVQETPNITFSGKVENA